jgi:hypothetical protein
MLCPLRLIPCSFALSKGGRLPEWGVVGHSLRLEPLPGTLSLSATDLLKIRGSAEVLRFALLTRDQKSPSLTRRSDGSHSKDGKAKSKFLSASSAGIAKFPVLIVFFHPPKIASEVAEQISDPSYEGGIVSRYAEIKNATAEVVGVRVVKKTSTARAHEAIRDLIVANPTRSYQQLADLLGCSRWLVYRVAVEFGVRRPRGAGSPSRQQKQGGQPK